MRVSIHFERKQLPHIEPIPTNATRDLELQRERARLSMSPADLTHEQILAQIAVVDQRRRELVEK
jgi:hypothetical protein